MTWFLEGDGFALRPVRREDYLGPMQDWLNDREVTRYLVRGTRPTGTEALAKAYDAVADNPAEIEFAIVAKPDGAAIGVCGLHGVQWVARHAEFRALIGERRHWGRGIGSAVCRILVGYAFETLNLEKVWLGVNADNERAVRSYENGGFRREGVLRREVFRNGRYYDIVRMSILRGEYQEAKDRWPDFDKVMAQLCGPA